ARHGEQHELLAAGERGGCVGRGARDSPGPYGLGVGCRDARRPAAFVRDRTGHDRCARPRSEMSKVKVGFFSFTEITDPSEHHAYNEWHMLDHMPEQYPLDGIAYGQRWVSTPACRAARAASGERLDPIHYVTLYLMTDPVERTLQEFMELGRYLRSVDRFHLHRRACLSGPFRFVAAGAAPRVLISAEAVPDGPKRGVYVQ